MAKAPDNLRDFGSLLEIVRALRDPADGCPWDLEQTHRTLTRFALEETYELVEAIDSGTVNEMRGELGDVLLQVLLHAEIARQSGTFDMADVIETLSEKMIRRHPHVFGDVRVANAGEVLDNWAAIKAGEKGNATKPLSFDIPTALPALLRAQKIGEKTSRVAFDFPDARACWDKVAEETRELAEAATAVERQHELGDLLFSIAQWARHSGLDSEQALRDANQRLERRFTHAEALARAAGKSWTALSAADKDQYWEEAKRALG